MNIFITGAAGYVGGSIAERLRDAGHAVRGLVRRETQATDLAARGITPVPGDLDDHALLMREARLADAVINAASSDHRAAVEALLEALRGNRAAARAGTGASVERR